MKKIIRHELVEISIPAASTLTRFQFPDIANLRNSHIFDFQVYSINQVSKSIISGSNVISLTKLQQTCYITFVNYGGKEFLKQAPAITFNTLSSNDNTSTNQFEVSDRQFVGQKINYPKSFLEFTNAPADPIVTTCFLCSIYYSLPMAEEKIESGFAFRKRV